MRTLLALLLLTVQAHAGKAIRLNGWQACDTAGRSINMLTRCCGEEVACVFPDYYGRRPTVLSFLTCDRFTGNQLGKTLTVTFQIPALAGTTYIGGNSGGCPPPPNLRLYFTSVPGAFNYNYSLSHPDQYWWSQTAWANIEAVDGGGTFTFSAPIIAGQWTDAYGQTANFTGQVAEIGLAFGSGCFFDTGVGTGTGYAAIHILSATIQ